MKDREQMFREYRDDPKGFVDYVFGLQEELRQVRQQTEQAQLEIQEHKRKLAQAQAIIADLKQQLFGSKAEKLTPEQEEQLAKLAADEQEDHQQPEPLSADILEKALDEEKKEERDRAKRKRQRQRRHKFPVQLERRTETLEPVDKFCPHSGKERPRIGQEVTTEYEFEPAKLILKETVRPKYGECGCQCCQGVAIAELPPRLVPQSKLGLGLAVFLLLSRFDDHIAYYTLERNFLERFAAVIPRQQMVQWVEKIAYWLQFISDQIWAEMKSGNYLQVDETPVKVLGLVRRIHGCGARQAESNMRVTNDLHR